MSGFLRIFFYFLDIYEELNFSTYLSQLGGISTNSVDDEKGPNNDTGLFFAKDGLSFVPPSAKGSAFLTLRPTAYAVLVPDFSLYCFRLLQNSTFLSLHIPLPRLKW